MTAKWQRKKIDISDYDLSPDEREELGDLIIERIFERTTQENKDAYGKRFPGYSKSYIDSLDFEIAGKSKSRVDLQLSGDMLADMKVLNTRKNEILIGFENGTESNAKADGNIRGTYGSNTPNPKKARDFLGLTDSELERLVRKVKS